MSFPHHPQQHISHWWRDCMPVWKHFSCSHALKIAATICSQTSIWKMRIGKRREKVWAAPFYQKFSIPNSFRNTKQKNLEIFRTPAHTEGLLPSSLSDHSQCQASLPAYLTLHFRITCVKVHLTWTRDLSEAWPTFSERVPLLEAWKSSSASNGLEK